MAADDQKGPRAWEKTPSPLKPTSRNFQRAMEEVMNKYWGDEIRAKCAELDALDTGISK